MFKRNKQKNSASLQLQRADEKVTGGQTDKHCQDARAFLKIDSPGSLIFTALHEKNVFLVELLLLAVVEEDKAKDKEAEHHAEARGVVRVRRQNEPLILCVAVRPNRDLCVWVQVKNVHNIA